MVLPDTRENVTERWPAMQTEDPRIIDRLCALNGFDFQLWNCARRELCNWAMR